MQSTLRANGISKTQMIPIKNIKFMNKPGREAVLEDNRLAFSKNVDLLQRMTKDIARNPPEKIRALISKELFKGDLIEPAIRMRKIEEESINNKPSVIRQAEEIAKREE